MNLREIPRNSSYQLSKIFILYEQHHVISIAYTFTRYSHVLQHGAFRSIDLSRLSTLREKPNQPK